MTKLILLKGLPASGKSTWAKEQVKDSGGKIKRINKDDLRDMIDAGIWNKKSELYILDIQWHIVTRYLNDGYDVIVDNTNLHERHEVRAKAISQITNSELEIKLFDTSLEECIQRDSKRDNPVGKKVILQMWNQYLKPKAPKYNKELSDCIICDIDGTLASFGDKNPYNRDFENDDCIFQTSFLLESFRFSNTTNRVILLSGREDKHEFATRNWLAKNYISYDELYMRKTGDNRSDDIVKREMYESFIKDKYNVFFVVDDRMRVCRLWHSLGLFTFCVNQGFLEF